MSTLDDVKSMFGWFIGISVVFVFACSFVSLLMTDDREVKSRPKDEQDLYFKNWKRRIKIGIVSFVLCSISYNVIPNKNTMMQMAAASLVTVDNVKSSKEIVERVYTDIIDLLKGYTEPESKN
jgi:hypothetical protein